MPRPHWLALAAVLVLTGGGRAQDDDYGTVARVGACRVEERGYFNRLVCHGILQGTQINEPYIVRADAAIPFGLFTTWELLATEGMLGRWNATREPLTYYHRTGPVGAVFHHLGTRKGGADAAAPFASVGMNCGTLAAYARRGQTVSFYESQPALKELVADTDRHFTFIPDARARGAKVETTFGPIRKTLAAATDKRFAALFVEMIEAEFDPGDRLTLEAVRLYFDRVTPDGLVALHISNKDYQLDLVTASIARELKLVGRVWEDETDNRPGKTASTWLVLARTDAALGPLGKPTLDQIVEFGTRNDEIAQLLRKHGPRVNALDVMRKEWGGPPDEWNFLTPNLMSIRQGPVAAAAYQSAVRDDLNGKRSLGRVAEGVFGPMFRPLTDDPPPEVRTDAHRPALPRRPPAKKP